MASKKKFSTAIIVSLTIFMGVSLIIIASIAYHIRSSSANKGYLARFEGRKQELVKILDYNMGSFHRMIGEVASNRLISEYLTRNDTASLLDFIKGQNLAVKGVTLTIYDCNTGRFIPELPDSTIDIISYLTTSAESEPQNVRFKQSDKSLITVFSLPIVHMSEEIGTAFLVYDIYKDWRFWEIMEGMQLHSVRIVFHAGEDRLYDVKTGEAIPFPEKMTLTSTPDVSAARLKNLFPGELLLPLERFPGLYYSGNMDWILEENRSFLKALVQLCVMILTLTGIASVLLAKMVCRPLEVMSGEAFEIASAPSGRFLDEEKTGYIEFQKLAHAFNQVVANLLDAHQKLKVKAKRELDASEERYRLAVEAAPDGITINSLEDGRFIQINEAFVRMSGYTRAEVLGKSNLELNLFEKSSDLNLLIEEINTKDAVNGLGVRSRRKDGTIIDTLVSARKFNFEGEDCIISVVSDYSVQKNAEEKIRRSKETLQLILDSMPTGVIIVGRDRKIRHANKSALDLLECASETEILGKTCLDLQFSCYKEICPLFDLGSKVDKSEQVVTTRDGKLLPILKSVIPAVLDNEDVLIETFFDLTEFKKAEEDKKKLEAALQRASKMEAIGTMAGGIAHDLNNILSGLVSYPELLLMDLTDDSPLRRTVETIKKSGEKAAAIVQDMLTLARRGVPVTGVVNINSIVLEYLKSHEHRNILSFHPDIRVNVDLEPNALNIVGSDVHISKSIMNLVSNAAEAMPEGGRVNISTRNRYIDMPIRKYDTVKEGDYVVLEVSDNGTGISPEDQERIFEPFYTKKKMGKSGTGLGMAVVWGTVKDHNGYIDLESSLGEGTSFRLYFPVTRREPVKDTSTVLQAQYMGKGESILVVDDIREQREIASSILKRLGYTVAAVPSGEQAVAYMKQNTADLLVLDMVMEPGMDGLDTYKKILELHPHQKAVVASGFSETDRVREAQRLGAGAYVRKPYLTQNIGLAIRKELDG